MVMIICGIKKIQLNKQMRNVCSENLVLLLICLFSDFYLFFRFGTSQQTLYLISGL